MGRDRCPPGRAGSSPPHVASLASAAWLGLDQHDSHSDAVTVHSEHRPPPSDTCTKQTPLKSGRSASREHRPGQTGW